MSREFIATVDGIDIEVALEQHQNGHVTVRIGGRDPSSRPRSVDARRVRPGTWSLLVETRSYVVEIDERATGRAISHGHNEFLVDMDDAQRKELARRVAGRVLAHARGEVIRAPIAGKVVKLLVGMGDEVAAGQGDAVLEAMKMENKLTAERGGSVSEIHVEPGQSVETNDKLVTLS